MTGAGLVPELTTDQFLKYVPAVRELCDVTCRQVCNIDSTNMSPAYWLETVSYTHLVRGGEDSLAVRRETYEDLVRNDV